jgi:hypothetical protein
VWAIAVGVDTKFCFAFGFGLIIELFFLAALASWRFSFCSFGDFGAWRLRSCRGRLRYFGVPISLSRLLGAAKRLISLGDDSGRRRMI